MTWTNQNIQLHRLKMDEKHASFSEKSKEGTNNNTTDSDTNNTANNPFGLHRGKPSRYKLQQKANIKQTKLQQI